MPIVFANGLIRTMDADTPRPDWVLVDGPQIVDVGTGPPPAGEPYDLAGRTLLPGFQDSHVHPPFGGMAMITCDLHHLETLDEFVAAVAAYAVANPDRSWITGGGWAMDQVPNGIARAEHLDAVVPDRPVFLLSSEGHAAWANSRALELAGIDASTPDPPDGRIERDPDGTPNGTLQEGAADLVQRHAPAPTVEDYVEATLAAQTMLLSLGITGWQDAWVSHRTHRAYLELDASGRLIGSVRGALWWDRDQGLEQLDALLTRSGERGDRYHPGSVKLMVDGVCENGTAAMSAPYEGTDDTGIAFIPDEVLVEAVPKIMAAGLQPHFHAIGDAAIRSALDAVEAGNPADAANVRPHIAHIQVIDPADVPRFATLGVAANAQALWACNDRTMLDLTAPRLGAERTAWQYPFRDLLDTGARLVGGSDWAVSTADVFAQIAVAVTRTMPTTDEPFLPEQAITPLEMLTAFTTGSAFVMHRERASGSITAGREADLVVASSDPVTEEKISEIEVEATFVGGRLVHGS